MSCKSDYEIASGEKEITSACITKFSFKTNGYQGGDTGHGGYIEIVIEDLSSTDMKAAIGGQQFTDCQGEKIRLRFSGDCEIAALAEGLEFLARGIKHALKMPAEKKADAA